MKTRNLFLDDCPIKLTVEDDQSTNYVVLDLGENGENPNEIGQLSGPSICLRRLKTCKGWHLVVIDPEGEELGAMDFPAKQ